MYRVTIVELFPETQTPQEVKRFEQVVDAIDLPKVFAAINAKPRKPRVRKAPKE